MHLTSILLPSLPLLKASELNNLFFTLALLCGPKTTVLMALEERPGSEAFHDVAKSHGFEEQKVWLADQAAKRLLRQEAADRLKKVDRVGWSVAGGRVFVKPARVESGLTLRDLETMLRDLKG